MWVRGPGRSSPQALRRARLRFGMRCRAADHGGGRRQATHVHDVVGALTVGRLKTTPSVDYSAEDVRLAGQLARTAAPLLARAQRAAERARRQQGASELSRLAGSLAQSLSVSAVCERLVCSVL